MDAQLDRLTKLVDRLEALEGGISAGGSSSSGGGGDVSKSVSEYDKYLAGPVADLVSATASLNDADLSNQVDAWQNACNMVREFLVVASNNKKPSSNVLASSLLAPIGDTIMTIQGCRDSYSRKGDCYNHASTLSEAAPSFGWVGVEPTPGPFVQDMFEAGQFWSNKVRMQYKNTDGGEAHVAWVVAFEECLKQLKDYIKNFHTTGVTWNAKGGDFKEGTAVYGGAAPKKASSNSSSGAPPPPPAPKISLDVQTSSQSKGPSKPDTAGLFSEINQGSNITKGLRKVTDDMKTKNRPKEERVSVVKASSNSNSNSNSVSSKPKWGASQKKQEPVFERQGTKWVVEFQEGANLVIGEDEPVNTKQVVYMYKCTNTVVQIKGKLNHVTMDGCKKSGVVVEDVLSGCDAVNCSSCKMQITGACPSMSIDKTSGFQVILSENSLECEVITSKSDEMNVMVPGVATTDDWVEHPVPEQFRTTFNPETRQIETNLLEHV